MTELSPFADVIVNLVLLVLVGSLVALGWRVVSGKRSSEKLQASDFVTTVMTAIIPVVGLLQGSTLFVDLSVALAAFSFIGTLAIAQYIRSKRVF